MRKYVVFGRMGVEFRLAALRCEMDLPAVGYVMREIPQYSGMTVPTSNCCTEGSCVSEATCIFCR